MGKIELEAGKRKQSTSKHFSIFKRKGMGRNLRG